MGLFGKKEKKDSSPCGCGNHGNGAAGCDCGNHGNGVESCGCGCKTDDTISSIRVLGTGCASCHTLYKTVEKVVGDLGFEVETEYVTDLERIAGYGIMRMPALMINEKVVAVGKVLKEDEIRKLLLQ